MKTIAVVANRLEYAKHLQGNLQHFFKNHAKIICYSTQEVCNAGQIPADLVVVSAFTIFQNVKHTIRPTSEMIVASITINQEHLQPLAALPDGTRALLCNIDYRTCMQVIAELYIAGYRNLDLIPYWGEGDHDPTVTLAITPDEHHTVPAGITTTIDIGQRVIDLNCIYDIAVRLGIANEFTSTELLKRRDYTCFANSSIEKILGEHNSMAEQVNVLLTLIPQGILITSITGKICLSNEKANTLLEKRSEVVVGFTLGDILPELKEYESQTKKDSAKHLVVTVEGNNLVASVTQIVMNGEAIGTIITLDNFEEREAIQHNIRSKLSKVEHYARYCFDDIKGTSTTIAETITTAKRIAKSESSILIVGESGTGKEVFAQSIHNESSRKKYNFVAVNCAAIPENLLESEMFGYEEGSFTGAKRGGRAGYFELSHKGTIFLDEIAELPLQLQSKLLRVIEEKKIIKIGSQKIVDIDVRIIAATNKDLFDLMEKGLFREDLYYRLNVLPLNVPPLRSRREDIPLLLEHFKKVQKLNFSLSAECKKQLCEDQWRGNIRELRNTVEYIGSLNKDTIDAADLPHKRAREAQGKPPKPAVLQTAAIPPSSLAKSFLLKEGKRIALFSFILHELVAASQKKERMGRRAMVHNALLLEKDFTEAEIRSALKILNDYGFIQTSTGRGGSRITPEGKALFEETLPQFI